MGQGYPCKIAEKRIKGVFMNHKSNRKVKITAVLMTSLLLFTCFTTACQPTPEKEVVVDKNSLKKQISEKSIESQSAKADGIANIVYNWPLSYSNNSVDSTEFSITAQVIAKDATNYPIQKAKHAKYSKSQIDKFINFFAKGTELYRYDDVINTREEIEEQILTQKRLIHDIQSGKNKAFAGSIKQLNNYLQELQTKLETAPTQSSLTPVTNYFELVDANGELQLASLDNKMNFVISNNDYKVVRYYINSCEDMIALGEEESIDTISLSRADAESQAKDIIASLGYEDMLLSETSAGIYLADYSDDAKNDQHSVYYFYFTRAVNGIPNNYEETKTASSPEKVGQDAYSKSWPYEFISLAIDHSGVQEIIISGNLEIIDTVSSNVRLLSFEEIADMAKAYIKQKYVFISDTGKTKEIHRYSIDKIKLGYMQVMSRDETDEFLIIPVWDFFGIEYSNDEALPRRHYSYLTINAIDGSIIDRNFGY